MILSKLFHTLLPMYAKYFKKSHNYWNLNKTQLLAHPKNSLGYHLGQFLKQEKHEILPKLENHDCFHIITNYSTQVKDEIALQYFCFGNGERNLSAILVILSGSILLPEHLPFYIKSFQKGKKYKPFYHLNFKPLLKTDLKIIKTNLLWKN